MKTIHLATLQNSFQAYLLKDILSQEGIVSFMKNETIYSVYSIPGMDIEVLVFEDDYERAREIYERGFPAYKDEEIDS